MAARGFHSVFVVFCTVGITLSPLVAAPLTGFVYDQHNITTAFKSQARPGGGIGPSFGQKNPPTSLNSGATAFYNSWSTGIAGEPMQEYRGWFIDRSVFGKRGNMNVRAIKLKQDISCSASKPEVFTWEDGYFHCKTNMRQGPGNLDKNGKPLNSKEVLITPGQRLTVWAHEHDFVTATKTSATLFFAAMDGFIKGGAITKDPDDQGNLANISTISCSVSVEIVEDTLIVGSVPQSLPTPQINFLGRLRNPGGANNKDNNEELVGGQNLSSLALWFTMAPIVIGQSIRGAQPLYGYNEPEPPSIVTSAMDDADNIKWTIEYIENFIRVAIGALAQATSESWHDGDPVVMTSIAFTRKLDPQRAALLAIPPVLIVMFGLLLMIWNQKRHMKLGLPIMRKAPLSEILKSALTEDMYCAARSKEERPNWPSQPNKMTVKYEEIIETQNWSLVEGKKNTDEGDSRVLLELRRPKPSVYSMKDWSLRYVLSATLPAGEDLFRGI